MANRILQLVDMTGDKEPFCFIVAVGSNWDKNKDKAGEYTVTAHDKYTVYYALYIENKDAKPLYYYNGTWTDQNPRLKESNDIFNAYNVVQTGDLKGKRLQYYLISLSDECKYSKNSIDDGSFWDWLKGKRTDYLN